MKYLQITVRRFFTTILICGLLPAFANAAPILDVSGRDDTGVLLGAGLGADAAAMAFTIDAGFNDVAISAPISCLVCTGAVWLHRTSLGASAALGDLVAAESFNANLTTPLFGGLSLDPGLYFVIASIETGFGVWPGSLSPSINLAAGVTAGPYFTADAASGFVPFADFDVVLNGLLHLTVDGTRAVASVTETGSLFLLGTAFLALLIRRKPKRQS